MRDKLVYYYYQPHRSTTYVDAAYCYQPSSVICRSVTLVSPAKTAESIEMPFGLWARMGPRNHVLDGVPEVLREVVMTTIFWFSMGYNFACVIASGTIFDSKGGFSRLRYPMKT